jgi:hypothetical protein
VLESRRLESPEARPALWRGDKQRSRLAKGNPLLDRSH